MKGIFHRAIRVAGVLITGLLAVVSICAVSARGADRARVAIAESIVVHGAVVRMSDLLPAECSAELRQSAAKIALGEAPVPGGHRLFERSVIAAAVANSAELRESLEIPASVDVVRWARTLSNEEVFQAVQNSLRANHILAADSIAADEIEFGSTVLVGDDAALPEVTGIDLDSSTKKIRVRMWVPSEPRLHPIWVSFHASSADAFQQPGDARPVSPASGSASVANLRWTSSRAASASAASSSISRPGSSAADLVIRSGAVVELTLKSSGMRIATTATALQSGRQGEPIRIRIAPSGRVMRAVIAGPGQVEVNF